jgi:hypothetical protein
MHNGAIMPSEVRHRVDSSQAYPLVRLTGVLDPATAPRIRMALLSVLAGQPEAVVVDVDDLRLELPGAVDVLRDLHRDTADWPAAHLALIAAHNAGAWQETGWPVWPDSAGAFSALGVPDHDHRLSLRLDPVIGAARLSRELITDACARWELVDLAGSACIVATEMVNNVVAHAHTPMIILLAARGDGLAVAVRDESAIVPAFTGAPVAPTAYGGRGMLLIDSVASRWGNILLEDGKVVWALLAPDEQEPTAGERHADSTGMADPARG